MSVRRVERQGGPHGLTAKAPLRLHVRYAFHDWMWSGGTKFECGWRRRLARRLPLYFSDPDLDGVPRNPKKRREWFDSLKAESNLGPGDRVVIGGSPFVILPPSQTWGNSDSTTWTYR